MKNIINRLENICAELEEELLVDRLRVLQIIDVVENIKSKVSQLNCIAEISIQDFPIQPTEEDTYESVLQYEIIKDNQSVLIIIRLEFDVLNADFVDWDRIFNDDMDYLDLYSRLIDFNIQVMIENR